MEKVTVEYATLYCQEEPPHLPGRPVPAHVTSFKINNNVSMEAVMEASVRRLRLKNGWTHEPHNLALQEVT